MGQLFLRCFFVLFTTLLRAIDAICAGQWRTARAIARASLKRHICQMPSRLLPGYRIALAHCNPACPGTPNKRRLRHTSHHNTRMRIHCMLLF